MENDVLKQLIGEDVGILASQFSFGVVGVCQFNLIAKKEFGAMLKYTKNFMYLKWPLGNVMWKDITKFKSSFLWVNCSGHFALFVCLLIQWYSQEGTCLVMTT